MREKAVAFQQEMQMLQLIVAQFPLLSKGLVHNRHLLNLLDLVIKSSLIVSEVR